MKPRDEDDMRRDMKPYHAWHSCKSYPQGSKEKITTPYNEPYKKKSIRMRCPVCSSRHKDVRDIIRDGISIGFVVTCCDCGFIMPHMARKCDLDSFQSGELLSILKATSVTLSPVRCGVPDTECGAKSCPCHDVRKQKPHGEYYTDEQEAIYPEKYERDLPEPGKEPRKYL